MVHEKARGVHIRLMRAKSAKGATEGQLGPSGIDISYVYTPEIPDHREFVSDGLPSDHEEVA